MTDDHVKTLEVMAAVQERTANGFAKEAAKGHVGSKHSVEYHRGNANAIRAMLEENKRLRAALSAFNPDECLDDQPCVSHLAYEDLTARIDAALALHVEMEAIAVGLKCSCGWSWVDGHCQSSTVKALRGEK